MSNGNYVTRHDLAEAFSASESRMKESMKESQIRGQEFARGPQTELLRSFETHARPVEAR